MYICKCVYWNKLWHQNDIKDLYINMYVNINKGCCAVVYEFRLFVFSVPVAHMTTLRNAVCQTLIRGLS